MGKYDLDVKLVCRFYQGSGGWEKIISYLSSNGWTRGERRAVKDKIEIEFKAETMDGLEVLLSLKSGEVFPNPRLFKNLLECLLNVCWYIDVYLYFRNVDLGEVSRELGLTTKSNEARRLKLNGIEIFLEAYPSMNKITVSYRIGMKDVGRIEKIHSKLFEIISSSGVMEIERRI